MKRSAEYLSWNAYEYLDKNIGTYDIWTNPKFQSVDEYRVQGFISAHSMFCRTAKCTIICFGNAFSPLDITWQEIFPTDTTLKQESCLKRGHLCAVFGVFRISESDRISVGQKDSGKINSLKSCHQWDFISQQQQSLLWSLKFEEILFHAPLHFLDLGNFWNQKSVTVIHLKDLPFNTCLDRIIG